MQKLREMQAKLLKINMGIAKAQASLNNVEETNDQVETDAIEQIYHDISHLHEDYFKLTRVYIIALEEKLGLIGKPDSGERSLGGRSGSSILGGMTS